MRCELTSALGQQRPGLVLTGVGELSVGSQLRRGSDMNLKEHSVSEVTGFV